MPHYRTHARKPLRPQEQTGHPPKRMQLPEKFSDAQEAVIAEMVEGKGHLVCWAGPGSGKTTTLVGGLSRGVPGKPQVTAFSRSTKADFRAAIPEERADVNTIHSLAFQAVRRAYPRITLQPDGDSLAIYTLKSAPAWVKRAPSRPEVRRAVQLLGVCKAGLCTADPERVRAFDLGTEVISAGLSLLRLGDARSPNLLVGGPDQELEDQQAAESEMEEALEADRICYEVVAFALSQVGAGKQVDFNDLVYIMALDKKVQPWPRDCVIIDEAQDVTRAQERCVLKTVSATGRLFAVGDPNQAIFAFAGSDGSSLERLAKLPSAKLLLLGESFRCPQRVIAYVRSVIPGAFYLKPVPSAPLGDARPATQADVLSAIAKRLKRPRDERSCMVLGRSYRSMLPLWERMAATWPVAILGEQMATVIENFITRNMRSTIKDGRWLKTQWWSRLVTLEPEIAGFLAPWYSSYSSPMAVLDKARAICQPAVLPDVVTFATAHKAKGLEAQLCVLLEDSFDLGASREEQNVYYVAATRAKDELLIHSAKA